MSIERFDGEAELVADRRTIVTALPLKKPARERLAQLLGARVVDIREVVEHVDMVLTPPCSPQTVGALKANFEGARIVVVELDDWEFDIEFDGPVKRILQGGADAYLLADSLDELASKIAAPPMPEQPVDVHELGVSSTVDDVIAAFLRESVEYSMQRRNAQQDDRHDERQDERPV